MFYRMRRSATSKKTKEEDSLVNSKGLVHDPVNIRFATIPLLDEEVSLREREADVED